MRRGKHPGSGTSLALALMASIVLVPGQLTAAQAAPSAIYEPMQVAPASAYEPMQAVVETGQPGLLSLSSSVQPLTIPWLKPGDTFTWQIGLHLADQPLAGGTLEFIPAGGLLNPDANYRLTAQRCESQWAGTSGTGAELDCASGATTLLDQTPLEAGATPRIPFGNITASSSPHVLFTLSLPEKSLPEAPNPKEAFTFALGFTVMGDDAAGSNKLANTGLAAAGLLAVAVLLLGAGLSVKLAGRRVGKS